MAYAARECPSLIGGSAVLVAVRIGVTVPEFWKRTYAMAPSARVTPGRRSALETPAMPAITAATAAAAASGGTQPGRRRPGVARAGTPRPVPRGPAGRPLVLGDGGKDPGPRPGEPRRTGRPHRRSDPRAMTPVPSLRLLPRASGGHGRNLAPGQAGKPLPRDRLAPQPVSVESGQDAADDAVFGAIRPGEWLPALGCMR